jgi:hypothetical protein
MGYFEILISLSILYHWDILTTIPLLRPNREECTQVHLEWGRMEIQDAMWLHVAVSGPSSEQSRN